MGCWAQGRHSSPYVRSPAASQNGIHSATACRRAFTGLSLTSWPPGSKARQAVHRFTGWKFRSRRLLPTTNTEENAIAAPAIIGLSSPAAASGSAATL